MIGSRIGVPPRGFKSITNEGATATNLYHKSGPESPLLQARFCVTVNPEAVGESLEWKTQLLPS